MSSDKKDNSDFIDSSKVSPFGVPEQSEGKERSSLEGVNINCDIGEGTGNPALPAGRDELLMPFISSANIACGYHAGDAATIKQTIELCIKHNVSIGAHPSFYDKNNFGRIEMNLPADDLYDLVTRQLILFNEIAGSLGQKINHVKPHGALYNMSAKDALISNVIARAVKDFDNSLILFGLSGSHSISKAKAIGLKTASEVFADRGYQDDGSLVARSLPNALIEETGKAVQQVLQMIKEGTVTTISGKIISVVAETICIHGDGKHALKFAKAIYEAIRKEK